MGSGDCHGRPAHWLAMTASIRQTPIKVIGLKQQTRKLLFTQKGCHPERAQRVEGSTHFVSLSGKFSAKILRLRCAIFIVGLPPAILIMEIRLRYAQDDRVFCCLRLCAKQQFAGLLRKADSLNTSLSVCRVWPVGFGFIQEGEGPDR